MLDCDFSICKVRDLSQVDFSDEFYFIARTDEETSLVCSSKHVPQNAAECDAGWRAFRIQGQLDFSLIGILSEITSALAENRIGIFAISTYNTDYILVKADHLRKALSALEGRGYKIGREGMNAKKKK